MGRPLSRADVYYAEEGRERDTVVLHPADAMRTRRELAGKAWVTEQDRLNYQAWLACRRAGLPGSEQDFENWMNLLSEDVDQLVTDEQIDDAVLTGNLKPEIAENLREKMRRRAAEDGFGSDPLTPPSA